jgi:hypothetical protein
MSAPPGSPAYYWAIGAGGTFSNGTQVGTWTDQQASIVLTQTGGGSNAYNSATGCIDFTATNVMTTSASITLTQPYTISFLFNPKATGSTFIFQMGGVGTIAMNPATPTITPTSDNSNSIVFNATGLAASTICTITVLFNAASSKCYVNGVLQTISSGSTVGTTNYSSTTFDINGFNGGSGATASWGSIIFYNNDATTNAAAIDTWLRNPAGGGGGGHYQAAGSGPTYGANYTGGVYQGAGAGSGLYQAKYTGGVYQSAGGA